MSHLIFTPEQNAIMDRVKDIVALPPQARYNLFLRARAGASKTTMLCAIAGVLPAAHTFHDGPTFLAFNKAIATELQNRLPAGTKASTFHSFGFGLLRNRFRSKTDSDKYRRFVEEKFKGLRYEEKAHFLAVLDRARNAALAPVDIIVSGQFDSLVAELGILPEEMPSELTAHAIADLLARGIDDTSSVDFTDMLYLPYIHGIRARPINFILIDEAQDTNKIQLELLRMMSEGQSSYIFVGDDRQAIYGFRGAYTDAVHRITDQFHITPDRVMPLSVSFRCPTSVIREAQEIVPDIVARDSAPAGLVAECDSPLQSFPPASLVVCRNNKPLARVAMQLLRIREPFEVLSDFFPRLSKFVTARAKETDSTSVLRTRIVAWEEENLEKLPEERHEAIIERSSTLLEIIDGLGEDALVRDVITLLGNICNSRGGVRLATIHKSKGLEAEHVFFLRPDLVPSKYATTQDAIRQEMNLRYVAITRAKQSLVYWTPDYGNPTESAMTVTNGAKDDNPF